MGDEIWTAREIAQQPETLRATQAMLSAREGEIADFLAPVLAQPGLRIVLTGAGTSSFIGDSIAASLARLTGKRVEAVATTDIVSAPGLYLQDVPTLLVSFGRSGNSPESVAAVDYADVGLTNVRHLVITCNGDGALAKGAGADRMVIILPEETHDHGFAMTSSFTAMIYAAVAILRGIDVQGGRISAIATAVATIWAEAAPLAKTLAAKNFDRVAYLGSGPFHGLACEAALKLLEMTDGQIVALADTPLGFRHGPKTVVNERTLIVLFLSNDPHTRRYDMDMLEELRREGHSAEVLAISAQEGHGKGLLAVGLEDAADIDLLFPFIVPAQLLALEASLAFDLTPDRPSRNGAVSRVVQGVPLYPWPA